MLRSLTQANKTLPQTLARLAHKSSASNRAQLAPKSAPGEAPAERPTGTVVDEMERPRPAMTSQLLGVSLHDMATPASCMAARAIRNYRERLAQDATGATGQ